MHLIQRSPRFLRLTELRTQTDADLAPDLVVEVASSIAA